MRVSSARPEIVGPHDGPEPPFPVCVAGEVVAGFGRGSKELGIPTANIPVDGLAIGGRHDLDCGIYYGWAAVEPPPAGSSSAAAVYPMVMSCGWNPFYKNTRRSVEVHLIHQFQHDFYGAALSLVILGYIRPEFDYVSREALIADIKTDIDVAMASLARPPYAAFKSDAYLACKASAASPA